MVGKVFTALVAAMLTFGSVAQAQPAPSPSLTLGECVRRALERGFDMEIQGESLAISREALPIARGAFHPILSASVERSVIRSAADALLPRTRTEGTATNLGVAQRLHPGTQIGFGTTLNRSQVNPALAALNPAYASDLTLAIRQPLLRDAGSRANTTGIRRAELELDNARRDYRRQALDVIQATENAYYLYAGAHEQLAVFNASLQLAEKLHREAQLRKQSGMSTGLDVLQAEVGIANAKQGVLQAESDLKSSQDTVLALIGRFEFDIPLNPTSLDAPPLPPAPRVESSYELASSQQPELLAARAELEFLKLDEIDARNALRPVLDLDVAFGVNATDATGRSAFSSALENDAGIWQAGLTLTFPWGRGGEKARVRQTEAAQRRQALRISRLEQDLLVQVRNAVRRVDTSGEGVELSALAARLAERQYEAERNRFKAGLTTSRRVLEAQTDLERARVAHLQARLDLQIALSALRRIEGSGLEYYR